LTPQRAAHLLGVVVVLLLLLLLLAGRAEGASVPAGAEPVLRIGLGKPRARVEITGAGPFLALDPSAPDTPLWQGPGGEPVFVAASGPGAEAASTRAGDPLYRIMVASSRAEASVRALAGWLGERLPGRDVRTIFQSERGAWRAYAGAFRSREEAAALVPVLLGFGLQNLWITERTFEERPPANPSGKVHVSFPGGGASASRIVFEAGGPDGTLSVDGREYRGGLEVAPGPGGLVTVVNVVPLEAYLRGVVPREMGPDQFPRLEALKAQAVAARTYALANRGQFDHLGYDLCDGPRCQAYGGVDFEHPLSDRAVRQTAGEVLLHDGRLIRAYFTASCGGHTENLSEVFVEEEEAYLVGVPCPGEKAEGFALRADRPVDIFPDRGAGYFNYDVARLVVRGVAGREVLDRRNGWGRPSAGELAAWAGRIPPAGPEVLEMLEAPRNPDGCLRDPAGPCSWSRMELLARLARALDEHGSLPQRRGKVAGFRRGRIRALTEGGKISLEVAGDAILFEERDGRIVPAAALAVEKGDGLRWPGSGAGPVRLLVVERRGAGAGEGLFPEKGRWEQRRRWEELEERLRSRTGAGGVQALVPLRLTPSGRVTEVLVRTAAGDLVLRGIRVRWGLGVRENLVRWEPAPIGAGGPPSEVLFTGHGWGHGVGLCQVGSFGMARRGAGYRTILRHYYHGVRIERAWPPSPRPDRVSIAETGPLP